jgi:hypothetical protein
VIAVVFQGVPGREPFAPATGREGMLTVLAVAVTLAAAAFWTRDLRPYASRGEHEVTFRPWLDYFVHAQLVGQVRADRSLVRLGNPDLAGLPLPFYHYASYIFPASVSAWTGQTAYDSLASFWTPFGVFLTGLAAYMLGSGWWNASAGLAAVIGVLLMPDASTYGIGDAYHSYHWLVLVSPGLLYGIAAGAVGLLLVTRGIRPTNWRCLGAAFGLVMMCIPLKAHLFVVVCPLLVLWVVLFKEGWTRRQRLVVSAGLAAFGLAGLLVADRYGIGPTLLPVGPGRPVATYVQDLAAQLNDPVRDVLRVIVVRLGIPALLAPILALLCYYRKTLQPVDAIPALAMLIMVVGAIFLPPNAGRGTADEMRHRPFVWAYFVVAAWTWGKGVSTLDSGRTVWQVVVAAASIVMLAWPWTRGATAQDPVLPWSQPFVNVRVATGLVECAAYLREHTAEEDIVQDDVSHEAPILGALAERRCYLAHCTTGWEHYDPNAALVDESVRRAASLPRIRQSTTRGELRQRATEMGIRWYVAHPGEELDWPAELVARPVFQSDGYRVYDLHVE